MNNKRLTKIYIALLFFAMIMFGASKQAFGALISKIIAHYDIKMVQAGLLYSINSAGNFVSFFIVAIFVGRINKMLILGSSIFFMALSMFLISTAPAFGLLFVCFALLGIFAATSDTMSNPIIADLRPDKLSGNISMLHGLYGVGSLCGPIIMEALSGRLSWSQIYGSISLVFIIYLVIYSVVVKRQWKTLTMYISNEKQSRISISDILKFFTEKRNILLWITMLFYIGNQGVLSAWIKRYVEIQLGLPVWGAYALSALWLGTTIGRLFISPNLKVPTSLQVFFGNLIALVSMIAGLSSGSAMGITAAAFIVGLGAGSTYPLLFAIGCGWYPGKTAFGVLMPSTASFIGFVIFPPFSGFVSDHFGMLFGILVSTVCGLFTTVLSGMLHLNIRAQKQTAV